MNKKKYYVYIWYVIGTLEVFYVGKGKNSRASDKHGRNKKFKKYIEENDCDYCIIKYLDKEEDAYSLENALIMYFRYKGMAKANILSGFERGREYFVSEEVRQEFVDKMTKINQERCNTKEFKELHRKMLVDRYSDINERKKQSEKIRQSWSDETLRKEQAERSRKAYYKGTKEAIIAANEKEIVFELNGNKKIFNSRKECLQYLSNTYNFNPSHHTLGKILKGEPYYAYHKRFKCLDGMRLYYK